MSVSVLDIATAIQGRLDTIASLTGRTYAYQPADISPPCAWVWLPDIPAYHAAMGRGTVEYHFPVYVMVGSQSDHTAQEALSDYISPASTGSVLTAIESGYDTTTQQFGGISAKPTVVDFRPTTVDEAQTLHAVGGVWTVHVTASGV